MKWINGLNRAGRFHAAVLLVFGFTTVSGPAHAQELPDLLVLGTAHFNTPGNDMVNVEVEDVLSDRRQGEIEALIDDLATFRPTHIAVEVRSTNQESLDKRYSDYRDGKYALTRNEVDQIGLRLAARLGHERVYAVDWNGNPPGDIEADYDWYSYGQKNGFEEKIHLVTDPESAKEYYTELQDQTISEWLRQLNSPDALKASHKVYFDIAMIGQGDDFPGANWVGTWYARNLKIFSRLVKIADKPTDRVLVLYGQGHAYLLQQFAREYGAFDLTTVEAVIGN